MHSSFRQILLLFCLVLGLLAAPAGAQEDFDDALPRVEQLLENAANSSNATEAANFARQALKLGQSLRNQSIRIRAHRALAEASIRTNEADTAIVHYLAAVRLAENAPEFSDVRADIFSALGDIFFRAELVGSAIAYYDSVLALRPDDLRARERKGDAWLLDGKIGYAEQAYGPIIERYFAEGALIRAVEIYQRLADACNAKNEAARGLEFYHLIQGIVERVGSPSEKARLYNNMGYQYFLVKDFPSAIRSLEKARLQCQYTTCEHPEFHLTNLGIVLHNSGDSKTGILRLLEARDWVAAAKDDKARASLEQIISKTYFGSNDVYNALEHNTLAIRFARKTKQHDIWRDACKTAAELHLELFDHEKAIDFYREYLRLDDSLRRADGDRQRSLLSRQALLERTEKTTQLILREQTIKELYLERTRQEEINLLLENSRLAFVARQKQDSLVNLQNKQQISEGEARQRILELLQIQQKLTVAQKLAAENALVELRRSEEQKREQEASRDSIAARELSIERQKNLLAELRIEQDQTFRKFTYGAAALSLVIIGLLAMSWYFARRAGRRLKAQNRRIEAQKTLIEAERAKSDLLLLNILPDEIARELKASGEATPRQYAQVTVLFTDFVNFSRLSERMSPNQMIAELNECFLAFDLISEKFGLEKIKTIGDAYMCAGGVPVPNTSHPTDAVGAALEMSEWLKRRSRESESVVFREMRIGVHTGPVIAGVIGKNKFAYDIWGDAVNLAARLEELSEPGEINISGATFLLVKERFRCTYRGKKDVYNKGLVDMYFVEGEMA